MAAVATPETGPDDLVQRFASALARVDAAVERAGLRRDPYGEVMTAQAELASLSLPILQRFEAAAERGRQPIGDRDLDRLTSSAATGANRQAAVLARAHNWRTLAMLVGGAVTIIAASGSVGYWQGHRNGVADGQALGLSSNAVIATMPATEGMVWEQLIRDNPHTIAASFVSCQNSATRQDGRLKCQLPVWIEEPSAPVR
jgi:hypothetical protein